MPGTARSFILFWKEAAVAWIYLLAAGILETLWAVAMKASNGFTLLIPSLITVLAMIGSVALLALAMKTLPLGTAYVVWTGIGAVGAFAAGVVIFGGSSQKCARHLSIMSREPGDAKYPPPYRG